MPNSNRNAIRSKKMLRKAYIELSAEQDASKITVVDVVKRADLSRNTFYAHYPDVNAIAEEIENEFIIQLTQCLDQASVNHQIDHPLPLLRQCEHFILSDEENHRLLAHTQHYPVFLEKLKGIFFDKLINYIDDEPIRDKYGFLVFVRIITSGVIELYTQYLRQDIDLSLRQINDEINRIYMAGVLLYK